MTVDYRFRNDTEITDISAAVFFTETLPGLWQTSAGLVTPWLQFKAPGDLNLECEGAIWNLAYCEGELSIQPGASESGLHVRLSKEDFSGLINDLYTPMTFYTGGTLTGAASSNCSKVSGSGSRSTAPPPRRRRRARWPSGLVSRC